MMILPGLLGLLVLKGIIEVAKRALFEFQKSSHLQPLAATRVASSGCEWPQAAVGASGCKCPQVAAWIANPCPEGHVPQNLKKSIFLQTGFFSSLPCNI